MTVPTHDELDALPKTEQELLAMNAWALRALVGQMHDAITALRRENERLRDRLDELTDEGAHAAALTDLRAKAEAFDAIETCWLHVGFNEELNVWVVWERGSPDDVTAPDLLTAVRQAKGRVDDD